jgi:hypothetical protein
VVSAYSVSRPKLFGWLTGLLFWEPAHWIMQTRQFRNLKARVEQPLWVQKGELHAVSSAE